MSRLPALSNDQATDTTRQLFDGVKSKLGTVPNMMRAMGNSPAVLNGYLQFSGGLAKGSLSAKQRELIALAVGQANECDYCLAAHSALGKMAGLSAEQITDARRAEAVDSTDDALVKLATKLVRNRGHVSDDDLRDARSHGLDDAAIAEVIANVALNVLNAESVELDWEVLDADTVEISGYDNAGWTLEDYVLPRRASGNTYAEVWE